MKTYRLHLIRHGLTDANVQGRYAGITDVPVNEAGRRELRELKETHRYPPAARFYSAPLSRCIQTLDILYDEPEIITVPELTEWNFGEFENKTPAELAHRPEYRRWVEDSFGVRPPGGESAEEFFGRVRAGFGAVVRDLMQSGEENGVLCTHGGVIMALLSAFGVPEGPFSDRVCGNGRGYTLLITPSVFMRVGKAEIVGTVPEGVDPSALIGEQKALFEKFGR